MADHREIARDDQPSPRRAAGGRRLGAVATAAAVLLGVLGVGPAAAEPRGAIAMHGTPLYPPDFAHFAYADPKAPKGGRITMGIQGTFDQLNPFVVKGNAAVGLRDLSSTSTAADSGDEAPAEAPVPTFKQYREADGKFYFKLMQGDRLLLTSIGFDSPRDAGRRVAAMKEGALEGHEDFQLADGVSSDEVNAALARFVAAQLDS